MFGYLLALSSFSLIMVSTSAFAFDFTQGLLRPHTPGNVCGCQSQTLASLRLQGVHRSERDRRDFGRRTSLFPQKLLSGKSREQSAFSLARLSLTKSFERRVGEKRNPPCSLHASAAGFGLVVNDFARDVIGAVLQRPWLVAFSLFVCCLIPLANFIFRKKENLPPVAPGVTVLEALKKIPHPTEGIPFLKQIFKQTGYPIFRIDTPIPFNFFWIGDPEATRLVIAGNRSLQIEELDKAVSIYAGLNVVTNQQPTVDTKSTYDKSGPYCGWQETRASMAPSFSTQNLLQAREVMVAKVETLSSTIERHIAEGKALDMGLLMTTFTFDFLCSSLFDLDLQMIDPERQGRDMDMDGKGFILSMRRSLEEVQARMGDPLRKFLFWTDDARQFKADQQRLRGFAQEAFERYKQRHTAEALEADTSVIGHLLQVEYPSEDQRIADAILFLLAGYDTTAHSICWVLIELLNNPSKLSILRQELDKVEWSESVLEERGSELRYLSQCIKETGRLWPVVGAGIYRTNKKDISLCGYHIPKGSVLIHVLPHSQRSAFADGDSFVPERWAAGEPEAEKLNKYVHAFSSGRRNCLGQNLALIEMNLVLCCLLQRFDFTIVSDYVPKFEISYFPSNLFLTASCRETPPP